MVLIIREGCHWCDRYKAVPDIIIAHVVNTVRGPMMRIGQELLQLPAQLPGYPALVDGERIYIGMSEIQKRLERHGG